MAKLNERRRHVRLLRDDKLFIQILAASETPDIVGDTFYCATVDVAESGIRLEVSREVAVNSEIDLWIDVKVCARKYFLRGQVKWCYVLDASTDIYQLGIELYDQNGTDFEEWQMLFIGMNKTEYIDT
ncbi:MAG: PilZ domain-containing protein [Gammaproteobacteria bacterium]|nr:PilZ domain-containing protein [Gammaproteobacteria bacterium]